MIFSFEDQSQRTALSLTVNGITFKATLKKPRKKKEVMYMTDPVLVDEVKFTLSKMRAWGRSIALEKKRMDARKKSEADGTTIECTCCYGDYAFMEMVHCIEGHLFCMDCVKRYAEEKVFGNGDLGGDGSTELQCMHMDGCKSFFSRDSLQKSLSDKVMAKYDELQASLVLEKAGLMSELAKCPQCDFQASLPESEKILECPQCGFESCRLCGEESHIPLRCEEVEKKTETSARLQVEEAMSKARIRHCPKGCKQGFYKVEGCNKMTCPTCKTFICYQCRAEIPKKIGYAHFCQTPHCDHKSCNKCQLYSEAEEDDLRASQEAGLLVTQKLKDHHATGDVAKKMEASIRKERDATAGAGTGTGRNAADAGAVGARAANANGNGNGVVGAEAVGRANRLARGAYRRAHVLAQDAALAAAANARYGNPNQPRPAAHARAIRIMNQAQEHLDHIRNLENARIAQRQAQRQAQQQQMEQQQNAGYLHRRRRRR